MPSERQTERPAVRQEALNDLVCEVLNWGMDKMPLRKDVDIMWTPDVSCFVGLEEDEKLPLGQCDMDFTYLRAKIIINIDAHAEEEELIKTVLHELCHVLLWDCSQAAATSSADAKNNDDPLSQRERIQNMLLDDANENTVERMALYFFKEYQREKSSQLPGKNRTAQRNRTQRLESSQQHAGRTGRTGTKSERTWDDSPHRGGGVGQTSGMGWPDV